MKRIIPLLLAGSLALEAAAQNIFDYNDKVANGVRAGITTDLAVNSSGSFVKREEGFSHTAKGTLSLVPSVGGFIQVGMGQRLSFRGSLAIGYSSYAYKYAQVFDSLTENFTPTNTTKFDKYTRIGHGSAFVLPQIDLGYLFGPFKKIYLLEARAGVGLHCYLAQNDDSAVTVAGGRVTDPKGRFTYPYTSYETATYGGPRAWGSIVTNVYIGVRWWKTTSEFLNHCSLGIQATLPVSTGDLGYAQLEYRNDVEMFTREKVQLGLLTVGVRFTYSFL